jgi:hypothetical protein
MPSIHSVKSCHIDPSVAEKPFKGFPLPHAVALKFYTVVAWIMNPAKRRDGFGGCCPATDESCYEEEEAKDADMRPESHNSLHPSSLPLAGLDLLKHVCRSVNLTYECCMPISSMSHFTLTQTKNLLSSN